MTSQAPFHPDTIPAPKKGGAPAHELLDDVLEDEDSSRRQRVIGWLCGLLTVAAVVVAWRLL